MTRNLKGGNKTKKEAKTKLLTYVKPGLNELVGVIENKFGNGRFHVQGTDGKNYIGRPLGKFYRGKYKQKFALKDIVLIQLNNMKDEKNLDVDIIHKYNNNDINLLRKEGKYNWSITVEDHALDDAYILKSSGNDTTVDDIMVDNKTVDEKLIDDI